MSDDKAWRAGLRVGDEVAIVGGLPRRVVIASVTRATATQVVAGGTRFTRRVGRQHGGGYWPDYIRKPTDKYREQDREHRMRTAAVFRLDRVVWEDLDTETLDRVIAALDAKSEGGE